MLPTETYDVVVIGGGVVGCSIAREFSRYRLRVALLERGDDVAPGTSKTSTGQAISEPKRLDSAAGSAVPTGSTITTEEVGMRLTAGGAAAFESTCQDLGVPFQREGSLMVVFDQYGLNILQGIYEEKNGMPGVDLLGKDELLKLEPYLNPEVLAGIHDPYSAIFSPWELTIAYAENAIMNGAEVFTSTEAIGIECDDRRHIKAVQTNRGRFLTRYVVVAAGVYADRIARMVGIDDFDMRPRKGQYIVMDQNLPYTVNKALSIPPIPYAPIQNTRGSYYTGFLVCPTVYGNMLLGPTAEDQMDKEDLGTSKDMLDLVWNSCKKLVPALNKKDIIRQFAGLRPVRYPDKISISASKEVKGFCGVVGLRSEGLSVSPVLGDYVREILAADGLVFEPKPEWNPVRPHQPKFKDLDVADKRRLIAQDPNYAEVICRCETVTKAEILQAIHGILPARSVDAVKKRMRPGMGRCQGGYCGPRIAKILSEELGVPLSQVTKRGGGSNLLIRPLKDSECGR